MNATPRHLFKRFTRSLKKGFTLVEILAVVAIIAILATLTLNISKSVSARQAQARAQADMAAIAGGLEAYKSSYGDYLFLTGNAPSNPADMRNGTDFERYMVRALMGDWFIMLDPENNRTVTPGSSNSNTNGIRSSFVDPTAFRYSNNTNRYNSNTANIVISDPWGNAYAYRYKSGLRFSSGDNIWYSSWVRPGFLLMSMGPDGTLAKSRRGSDNLPGSMSTTGIIPTSYREGNNTACIDNIIYGENNN